MLDHRGEDLPRLVQLTAGIERVMADNAQKSYQAIASLARQQVHLATRHPGKF